MKLPLKGVVRFQRVTARKKRLAKELRRDQTTAEEILWGALRREQVLGLKFRRQQIIEGFIADFFCDKLSLVIEVDGSIHNKKEQKERDRYRRKVFKSCGLFELRFRNEEVFDNLESVVKTISKFAETRAPTPPGSLC
jgi:very-short-patch-repair endonuclease